MSEHVLIERSGAVLTLRMSRPEKKNAITAEMYHGMIDGIRSAVADDGVRVIMLAGAAGMFTSGNDLRDFMATPPGATESPALAFLAALSTCPKPVVAAVSGLAIGIGTTMLLHCDLVVADPDTRFSLPFINLGLVPEGGSSLLLPRMVGHVRAAELLLLGDVFDAATAERVGIVNKCSAIGAVEKDAMAWAQALAKKAPAAMRMSKALLKASADEVAACIQREARQFLAQLGSPDFREAATAFMEKREPRFE